MQRRDLEIVILSGLFGPPLASFLFLFGSGIGRYGIAAIGELDLELIIATWPFAYLIAGVPTLVGAVANAVVARWAPPQGPRLLLALPLGAAPYLLSLGWLADIDPGGRIDATSLSALGLTGAAVSLLCVALVESFGTPLREGR